LPSLPPAESLPRSKTTNAHIVNLDVLRAVAALMIVVYHFQAHRPFSDIPWLKIAEGWHVGVDIFFVLSGYLIGGLYWRELLEFGNVEVGRFWARRWLRTIPPYLVILQLYFLAKYVQTGGAIEYDPRFLLFLQNYTGLTYFGPSWSLCVEEHFYLAAPLLLRFVTPGTRSAHWFLGAATVLPAALRVITLNGEVGGEAVVDPFFFTHLRCDLLVLGVWLAYIKCCCPNAWQALKRWAPALAIPAGCLLFGYQAFQAVFGRTGIAHPWFGLPLVGLCSAALLVALDRQPLLGRVPCKVASLLAGSSYSLYMTHYLVLMVFLHLVPGVEAFNPYLLSAGLLLLSIAVGYATSRVLEVPAMKVRERWAPRRPSSPSKSTERETVGALATTTLLPLASLSTSVLPRRKLAGGDETP